MRRQVPLRGQLAAARSYRNLQHWSTSLDIWQQALRRHPGEEEARAGWVMTLSDAGREQQARRQATRFVQEAGSLLSYQVFIYVYSEQHSNAWDELFALTRLQDLGARHQDLDLMLVNVMAAQQVASPALELGSRVVTDPAVRRKLELDQAAELVRMAHTESRGEREQYTIADRALKRYAELLQLWQDDTGAADDIVRARTDRLGALLVRNQYATVINEYESLHGQGHEIPDYALRWVASAYLSEKQPETAFQMLRRLFAGTPVAELPVEDSHELFFAALESEQVVTGGRLAQKINADTPYYRYVYGSPVPQPNDKWLSGQVLQGHYLQKSNRLGEAEQHNRRLVNSGPGNQGLRVNLAETLLARGLPRAAEHQLKIAEVQEPGSLVLEREQSYVAQTLQEWKQFDLLVEDVVRRSPREPSTVQLARAHQVENMSEFRLEGSKGISSGNPVSGSHDLNVRAALYAPRQAEHWRPFVGFDYASGRFDEGKGSKRLQAAGVEYTRRDNWAEVEVSNQRARGKNKTGLRFSYWHDFNDNWRAGAEAERLSRDTPLRAIRNGVTSNKVGGYVRWYQHESREYQLNAAGSHFSDGNNRREYGVNGRERIYRQPHFTVDWMPSISMGRNSKRDVPYYNPRRDLHAASSLYADHVLYRRYETSWRQQFLLGVGRYWQKGYSSGTSNTAGYGQRFATNNVFDTGAMLVWHKQPYDGKREHDLTLVFDLNYRF